MRRGRKMAPELAVLCEAQPDIFPEFRKLCHRISMRMYMRQRIRNFRGEHNAENRRWRDGVRAERQARRKYNREWMREYRAKARMLRVFGELAKLERERKLKAAC